MLTTYENVNNTANQRFDGSLEAGVEAVPQITIDRAGYVIQRHYSQPYAPFSYRNAHFYIPSLPAGARGWFAAYATAVSGKRTGHQLLLFVQSNPDGPWKLAAASVLASRKRIPVALSSAGTAAAVPAGEPGLALTPSQLPARHAALLNGQPARPGFAAGPWTSTLERAIRAFESAYQKANWKFNDDWSVTGYPTYALRTSNGGAVVWYVLKDRQTGVRMGSGRPLQTGKVIRALTGKSQTAHRFTIDSLSEFVAIVPPHGKGKITIAAGVTGNVAATAS